MAPQEERITYYEQAEQQWEHDQAHTRAAHYRQSLFGRVADLHFTVSHLQSKLIAIDKQPDDDVMHLG
jgi:hypothetical protein